MLLKNTTFKVYLYKLAKLNHFSSFKPLETMEKRKKDCQLVFEVGECFFFSFKSRLENVNFKKFDRFVCGINEKYK